MNNNLLAIVRQIITQNGAAVLDDSKRFGAFLLDMAPKEPKPQRTAFIRCLMNAYHRELRNAAEADRNVCKQRLAERLHNDEGLDTALCGDTLDLLEAALFGTSSAAVQPPPAVQPVSPPVQPVPQSAPVVQPVQSAPPASPQFYPPNPPVQPVPAAQPRSNTARYLLIAAGVLVVLFAVIGIANSGGGGGTYQPSSTPSSASTATASTAATPAASTDEPSRWSGTMTKGNSVLNIRISIGLKDNTAVNTYYAYTKYNDPIPLEGGIYDGTLILREVGNENRGIFGLLYNDSDQTLEGTWTNSRDPNDVYTVKLWMEI